MLRIFTSLLLGISLGMSPAMGHQAQDDRLSSPDEILTAIVGLNARKASERTDALLVLARSDSVEVEAFIFPKLWDPDDDVAMSAAAAFQGVRERCYARIDKTGSDHSAERALARKRLDASFSEYGLPDFFIPSIDLVRAFAEPCDENTRGRRVRAALIRFSQGEEPPSSENQDASQSFKDTLFGFCGNKGIEYETLSFFAKHWPDLAAEELENRKSRIALNLLDAVTALPSPRLERAIIARSGWGSWMQRRLACQALRSSKTAAARLALIQCTHDEYATVRDEALWVLADQQPEQAFDLLAKAVTDRSSDLRGSIADQLVRRDALAAGRLAQRLRRSTEPFAHEAAEAIVRVVQSGRPPPP